MAKNNKLPLSSSLTTPTISSRFLVPVFRYLHKHHPIQAKQYLKLYALAEESFASEGDITMECFQNILEQAAIDCQDPNIGLHIYEELAFSDLGILGYAINSIATVGQALKLHTRYYHLYQSNIEVTLNITGDLVQLSYRILSQNLSYSRQDSEISCMYSVYLIRKLAQADWRPLAAHFQHAEPEDTSEHKRLICEQLLFNQATNKIIFDKSTLDLAIINANEPLANTLEEALRRIDKVTDNSEDSLIEKVQQSIVASLPEALPSIEDMASTLHLTARTLQRRLSEQGYNYSQLLDATRKSLATHYLTNTSLAATDIAYLLGYSESSAFDRAFKRWCDMTPIEYRRSNS